MSMSNQRRANQAWHVADVNGNTYSEIRDGVSVAVLMDIRDELQKLNRLLHCQHFQAIPHKLDRIQRQTARIPVRRKRRVTQRSQA